ncbi:MAG: tetratricopeptide repeat protein [Bacteriovorax sp.]|jgi:tetratricopeptide (TPR) repeat protein
MKKMSKFTSLLAIPLLASCSVDLKKIEQKAAMINNYEQVSLKLAKENRELHAEVKRLEFEVEKLKHGGSYNSHKNEHDVPKDEHAPTHEVAKHEEHSRSIASVAPSQALPDTQKDYVEFKTYKWHADDLMKIADKEFKEKNYEKAAQFYTSLLNNYPNNKSISDEFYFKAGIASYESGSHHDWTLTHFEALMSKYPTSQYFRSAKLWVALTHMKLGDKKKFYATVEEFRKKYRNTNEWSILSSYYEKIEEKTNE